VSVTQAESFFGQSLEQFSLADFSFSVNGTSAVLMFVNFMQEKIAMTQITKCVQTFFLYIAAGIIIDLNKDLFFGRDHIGNLLQEKE
jgi:hypothetical protein